MTGVFGRLFAYLWFIAIVGYIDKKTSKLQTERN